jgi:kumamolisin
MNGITIVGSHHNEPANVKKTGKTHGNTKVTVALSVATKSEALARYLANRHRQMTNGNTVAPLSARAFARRFGANPTTLQSVADHITASGEIELISTTRHSGEIVVSGRLSALRKIAQFEVNDYLGKSGQRFHARVGSIVITDQKLIHLGVMSFRGMDERWIAHRYEKRAPLDANSAPGSWSVPDLAARFNIPIKLLATGAKINPKIGLVELDGGYRVSDNVAAAKKQGVDLPSIEFLSVDGATNSPSTPEGADGEVGLDIQTLFPIGKFGTIVVGMGKNASALAFPHIIRALVDAGCKIISVSWGNPFSRWSAQDIQAMEIELARADALGVVVMVAAGDRGSTDGLGSDEGSDQGSDEGSNDGEDPVDDVDYPSASDHSTGAGGLFVGHDGSLRGWNDNPTESATGGGVSTMPVPLFQSALQKAGLLPKNADTGEFGRCVCDVSAVADPNSGVIVLIDGQWMVIGGTSLAAPFIALGLAVIIALIGKSLVGFNTYLYQFGVVDGFIIDVLPPGNNGAYPVLKGYDCPTGLGAIDFGKLLMSLQKRGIAQTQFDLA